MVNDAEGWNMRREDAAALLRANEINPTSQRIDVAAVLFARPQHVCADDVLRLLSANGTPVSKATVYNTLGLLARRGPGSRARRGLGPGDLRHQHHES